MDNCQTLKDIFATLLEISKELVIVFPVHPRTRQRIVESGLNTGALHLLDPLPYIEFLALQRRADVVITDSGGIQEETTYLGVPCLTLRNNTERPVTVTLGTNVIVGLERSKLGYELSRINAGKAKKGTIPPLWDGHAGERIAEILQRVVGGMHDEASTGTRWPTNAARTRPLSQRIER